MRFQYRAKNAAGKTLSGTVTAKNETDAVGILRRQGFTVLGVTGGKAAASSKGGATSKGLFNLSMGGASVKNARVSTQDMVVFTRQLSTMISAGIPVVEAVEILRRRIAQVFQIMSAVGPTAGSGARLNKPRGPELTVLATLFEPDRERLRRSPQASAHVLRGLTLAGTHPLLILDEPLSSEEIVSLVLDGIRARPDDG